jgi:hypothetical protein
MDAEGLAKAERDELKRMMAEEKITLLEEDELVCLWAGAARSPA